jgi:hypothetical protein
MFYEEAGSMHLQGWILHARQGWSHEAEPASSPSSSSSPHYRLDPFPSTNTWIAEDAYYKLASGHVVHEACRIRGSHWLGVFDQTCSYVNNEGKMQHGCENKFDEGECLSGKW